MSARVRRAALAAAVFAACAWRPPPVAWLDREVVDAIGGEGPRGALEALTWFGDTSAALVLALVAGLLLVRRRGATFVLVAGVLVASVLATLGKELVGRTRPPGAALGNSAFPSAHAARTGVLGAMLGTRWAIGLAVAVGLTRVLLGLHWPSDVAGGWALGLLVAEAAPDVARRRRK